MNYSEITPYIEKLANLSNENNHIRPEMYTEHHVNRGLRDMNGNGVVTGLTEISTIHAKKTLANGEVVPSHGQLFYRGINVYDLVTGFIEDDRFGFEETAYLLLFSELPDRAALSAFREALADYRSLPTSFVRDMILKAPGRDMMNILSRCVLALYAYDENPDDISVENVLRQCLHLISVLPLVAVYSYQSFQHYHQGKSLFIHLPKKELSTAENLLSILREDGQFTHLEARMLDLCMVLHAEHGGGNNSTFTTHVVTSSGTDTYSCMAAALASLKGPRHGGANIKVVQMFEDLKASVKDWTDEDEIRAYLTGCLEGQRFDKSGLIYGMGHAVYSVSDPRANLLRGFVEQLSEEKHMHEEYALYSAVERLAPQVISEKRKIYKGVSANVDFYSGFVYRMLGLPTELFTPIFAIARVAGWSAHRMEELINMGKIIRPAYMAVQPHREYVPMEDRG